MPREKLPRQVISTNNARFKIVLDKDKKVIAKSKLLSKDSLDIGVEWDSGDLNNINQPVSLRITLRNALLFALWCS